MSFAIKRHMPRVFVLCRAYLAPASTSLVLVLPASPLLLVSCGGGGGEANEPRMATTMRMRRGRATQEEKVGVDNKL